MDLEDMVVAVVVVGQATLGLQHHILIILIRMATDNQDLIQITTQIQEDMMDRTVQAATLVMLTHIVVKMGSVDLLNSW